jgi:hypothetical protein
LIVTHEMGLWAVPVYGLANFTGTLSSQPDYNKDFRGYARHISRPVAVG